MFDVFILITLSIYTLYIFFIISGLFKHKIINYSNNIDLPKISIVIAIRNEEENLPFLLKDLVKQNYPINKFEIIIVNDRSTDKSTEILERASKDYNYIKHIYIKNKSLKMTSKKNALHQGILNSSGEIILSSDGDCRIKKDWVFNMVNSTLKFNGISIGFSKVIAFTLFEKYQLIDFLGIITVNAGAAGWGQFWSGTGQNLAFFKKDYEKINGFEPVKNEISGDDMYLVQAITKLKTGFININPDSFVKTKALKTIKEFINQRARWSSNSKKNIKNKPFFLFLLSTFLINTLILFLFITNKNWFFIFFIKSCLDGFVLFLGGKLFDTKIYLPSFIIWALLQPIYIPLISIMGLKNKFVWKP